MLLELMEIVHVHHLPPKLGAKNPRRAFVGSRMLVERECGKKK
jgi:hypothetical protein